MTALTVYVGLGSNLGDPPGHLRQGFAAVAAGLEGPCRLSSLWVSSPEDCPPGAPDFTNAVAELWVPETWEPVDFLRRLLAIEERFGRRDRSRPNNPRHLDLDLLLWADLCMTTPELVLPHPRARTRAFVMGPLCELAPALVWPATDLSVQTLAAGLDFSRCRVLSA